MTPKGPQHWLHCTTCDVKFMSRSAESLRHGARHDGPDCVVIRIDNPMKEST